MADDEERRGIQGIQGEKGRRGRRGVMGRRGDKGDEADRLKLPRRVFIAFLALAIANAVALAVYAQQQQVIRSNQCSNMNRLAETKLFIRNILVRTGRGTRTELIHLTRGINALEGRVKRLDGCELFEFIDSRDRAVDRRYLDAS